MIPSEAQIAKEIAAFGPGLGVYQAINRIRQRAWIVEQQRRNVRGFGL